MIRRGSDLAMIAAAGLCAVAVPAWLIWPRGLPTEPPAQAIAAQPQSAPDIADPGERRLFAGEGDVAESALPKDAPELTGIAGRPPHDAVAMIRTADGRTRTLAPGESHAGWRLEAVSAEAALFSRGPLRLRVPMASGDPLDSPTDQ